MAFEVFQFPCLSDNYGYLLHDADSGATACIDTPEAEAINAALCLPQDSAELYREKVEAKCPPGDPADPAVHFVGGVFCNYGHPDDGVEDRLPS